MRLVVCLSYHDLQIHEYNGQAENDEKEVAIASAKRDCETYQEMLKEKDATIEELQKSVSLRRVSRNRTVPFGMVVPIHLREV